MAGPETGDRRTVRLFAVLGMGGSELGKVYLNVNKYIGYHTTDPGEQMAFVSSFLSWYDVHHLPDIFESNEMLQARRYKYPCLQRRSVRPCEIYRNVYFRTKPEKNDMRLYSNVDFYQTRFKK